MNAPLQPRRRNTSENDMSEKAPRRGATRARVKRARWAGLALGCAAFGFIGAGCGAPAEEGEGNGDIPRFGTDQGTGGSTGNPAVNGTANAGNTSSTCVPGSANCGSGSESVNPNAPIDQTQTSPI